MSSSSQTLKTMRVTINHVGDDGSTFSKTVAMQMDHSLSKCKDTAKLWITKIRKDIEMQKKLTLFFHVGSGLLFSDATTVREACAAVNNKCGTKYGEPSKSKSGKIKMGKALELQFAELVLPSLSSSSSVSASQSTSQSSGGTALKPSTPLPDHNEETSLSAKSDASGADRPSDIVGSETTETQEASPTDTLTPTDAATATAITTDETPVDTEEATERKSIDITDEVLDTEESKQQSDNGDSPSPSDDATSVTDRSTPDESCTTDGTSSGSGGSRPSTGVDTSTVPTMPMAIKASHTSTTPDTAAVADATMAAALDSALDTLIDGDPEAENKIEPSDSSSKPNSPVDKYAKAAQSIGPVMTRARSQRRIIPTATTPVGDSDSQDAIPETSEVEAPRKSGFPLTVSEVAMESISGAPAESPVFLALMFMEYEKRLSSMGSLMDDLDSLKHREEELMQQVKEYKNQVDHLTSVVNDRGTSAEPSKLDSDIGLAPDETEPKAASQLGLRKVKTSRRESRVQVVQLKIDAELQRGRNPKAVVPYSDDSPFWWRKLREHHARVKRLSDRLNTLCTMMEQGCVLLDQFSKQCADIFHSVKASWQDCEGELSSDILSLNSQFNELGEEFAHMSNASQQLSVTFRAVLITPFLEFVNTQWSNVGASYKAVKSHGLEYEKALKELLRAPKKLAPDPPGASGSLSPGSAMKSDGAEEEATRKSWGSDHTKSSGSGSTTTGSSFMGVFRSLTTKSSKSTKKKSLMSYSQQMTVREYNLLLVKVAQRRRDYELKRFQHCQLVNQVMHRHRYDLIVSICACFSGFETFFHVGYEGALAHKAFMRSIQRGVMTRMDGEDEKDAGSLKKERKLEENLSYGIAAAQSGKEVDNLHKSEFDDHHSKVISKPLRSATTTDLPTGPKIKTSALSSASVPPMGGSKTPTGARSGDSVISRTATDSESAELDPTTPADDGPESPPKVVSVTSVSSVGTSARSTLEDADHSLGDMPDDLTKTVSLSSAKSDPYDVDSWSGYLWKQSNNVLKDWKRRWFVMEQGELAYYRSKDKMDRVLMVNTMLSKVRDKHDSELRFVFEIVTPTQRIYTLQCENEADYVAWTSVLRNQPARMLRRNTMEGGAFGAGRVMRKSVVESRRRKNDLVSKIQTMNPVCCDCGKPMPEWLSINTGALICISCSGVHRSLGTHVSKVRSLMLDDINEVTLECIAEIGNDTLNEILEFNILSDYEKCSEESSMNDRERFIKAKFAFRMFVDTDRVKSKTFDDWNRDLWKASGENDLTGILRCIFFGANVDSTDSENAGRSALHIAAIAGHACAIELLLQNGANFDLRDDTGKSIRDLVQESGDAGAAHQVMSILDTHDPSYGKTSYSASESGKDDSDSGEEFSMDLP